MNKEYKSFIFTGDKNSCSGCGCCSQICRHNAIDMQPDEEGFLFPIINKEKCVSCGLCDYICPAVGNNQANAEQDQPCYIATTNKKEAYKESASIGICTLLSNYVVSKGGIVYGCYLDESEWVAYHIGVVDEEGIQKIRNSKYLQSDTRKTFSDVKNNLQTGRLILYIGTPCEIAGLKAYLRKDYSNLVTVDLICHGTFSPKLMPYEVKYWEKQFGGKIHNFRFRSKKLYTRVNDGMVNFDVTLANGKKKHIERFGASSPSYRLFAYSGDDLNYTLRRSCYTCPFRAKTRYADITVGDPWRISDTVITKKELQSGNVIRSLYSANTVKGNELLHKVDEIFIVEEFTREQSFVQDAVLPSNRVIPSLRHDLFERLENSDYGTLVSELLHCDLPTEHRNFVISYIKLLIKSIPFVKKVRKIINI